MGKNKYVASIVLEGEKEFKSAVTACNKKITSMRSELSLAKEKFSENANSLQALQAKHDILSQTLQVQKEKLEATKQGYNHAEQGRQKLSIGLQKLKNDYQFATENLDKMKKSGYATDAELEKQEQILNDLSSAIEKGEKNYQTAENRLESWKNKLNTAEAQVIRANKALKSNDAYLEEAKKSVDKCATSIDNYGKKVKVSEVQVKNFGDSIKSNLKSEVIISGIRALGGAIKQVGSSAVETAKDVGLYADDMNTLATQTGINTETLQELKYMEDIVDVSLETVTSSMARNIRSMSKAKEGNKTYAGVYKKLGVAITDTNGKLRDSEAVYWEVVDALGSVKNETERDADAMAIFGKSAQDLNPLIAQGIDGINEFKREAKETGAVLDQETLDSMNSVNDAFDRLTQQSAAFKRKLGVELAPSVLSAATDIGEAIQENKDQLIDLAHDGIDVVTTGLSWIIEHAQGVVAGITAIAGAYATLKAASNISSAVSGISALASFATPAGATVAVIGLLTTAILSLKVATSGNNDETAKEIAIMEKSRKAIEEKNKTIKESIKETKSELENTKEEIAINDNLVAKLLSLNKVQNKTVKQKQEMKGIVDTLKDSIPELAEAYDEETGSVDLSRKAILELAEAYKKQAIAEGMQKQIKEATEAAAEAEVNLTKAEEARGVIINKKKSALEEYEKARKKAEKLEDELATNGVKSEGHDEAQQKLEKTAQKVASLVNEEKKYDKTIKETNKTLAEANKVIDDATNFYDKYEKKFQKQRKEQEKSASSNKKTVSDYDKISSAFEKATKELDKCGDSVSTATKNKFNSAVKMAKKTGTDIPSGLAKGLKNGSKSPEKAIKEINKATSSKLLEMANDARSAGVYITDEITDGLSNGTYNVETAYKKITKAINRKADEQQEKLDKAYLKIPKSMKKAFDKGGNASIEAIKEADTKLKNLMEAAGVNSINGLLKGLEENKPRVKAAYTDIADEADNAWKKRTKTHSPSRVFAENGEYTVLGVISGVEALKGKLKKKYEELGGISDAAFRASLEIHSPSKKFQRSGNHTVDGLIKGIEQKKSNLKKSANELGNLLIEKMQNKIDMKDLKTNGNGYSATTITKYWNSVVKATKKGTSAHKEALKNYYTARNELVNEKKEKLKEIKSSYKEIVSELKEEVQEAKEEYVNAIEDTQKSISGTWGLFNKASVTKTNNADGLIRNMKSQATTTQEWSKNLDKLRKSGLSSALIAELEAAGLGSAGDVATLATMTKSQLAEYQKYYNQRNTIAKNEAVKENADLKKTTDSKIASLQKEANREIDTLERQYKKIQKQLKKLDAKTKKQLKNLGLNVSQGFAKGIASGSNEVYKSIAKMTGQTVKQVKKNLGIHSPSRVMAELGGYTGLGFAQGLEKETQNLASILTSALPDAITTPAVQRTVSAEPALLSGNKSVQLNMYMDSNVVATATFKTIDLLQGANIRLMNRGLAT